MSGKDSLEGTNLQLSATETFVFTTDSQCVSMDAVAFAVTMAFLVVDPIVFHVILTSLTADSIVLNMNLASQCRYCCFRNELVFLLDLGRRPLNLYISGDKHAFLKHVCFITDWFSNFLETWFGKFGPHSRVYLPLVGG